MLGWYLVDVGMTTYLDVMKNLLWMSADDLTQYHRLCMLHSVLTAELPRGLYETIGETGEQRHENGTRRAGAITLPQIRNEGRSQEGQL